MVLMRSSCCYLTCKLPVQEVIPGVGLGVQQFTCCRQRGILAYATEVCSAVPLLFCMHHVPIRVQSRMASEQESKPRLILWSQQSKEKCTTSLNAHGAVISLSFSNDGSHLVVSHGYPSPAVHMYASQNVRTQPLGSCANVRMALPCSSMRHLQLRLLASADLEHAAVEVQINPLDKNMVLCMAVDACCVQRCITHGNKSRLVAQRVNSSQGSPTCQAFHCMSIYLGTSDGYVCCFDFNGNPLNHANGERAFLQVAACPDNCSPN